MKKIINIVIILQIVIFISGCNIIKREITGDKFMEIASEMGYETEMWEEGKGGVLKFDTYIAKKNDYMVMFYSTDEELNNENFEKLKLQFGWYKDEYSGEEFTLSKNNFEKYSVVANDMYKVVCRLKNTTIRVDGAPIKYKKDVDELLNKLGY